MKKLIRILRELLTMAETDRERATFCYICPNTYVNGGLVLCLTDIC